MVDFKNPKLRRQLKDYLLSLCFANMVLVNIWIKFFYEERFYMKNLPTANSFLALILNELLLALCFWAVIQLARRWNNRVFWGILKFLVCLEVLLFIYVVAMDVESKINLDLVKAILLISTIVLIIFRKMTKVVTAVIIITTPFVIFIFIQAISGMGNYYFHPDYYLKGEPRSITLPTKGSAPPVRALWLIFDEMDQRIAFAERPKELNLPNFDRLKQESLYATNVYEPSNGTDLSLPALIDGKLVTQIHSIDFNKLSMTYYGTKDPVIWGSQPNIFSEAKKLKLNTAMVGEYIAYSRLIGKDLTFCYWSDYKYNYVSSRDSLLNNIGAQLYGLWYTLSLHYVQHRNSYLESMQAINKLAGNPNYGLIMVHFPIPHAPYFYRHWWENNAREGYIRNLEISDQAFGEFRKIMENNGVWDNTAILVSADHGYRNSVFDGKIEFRVPFILKLPREKEAITYESPFNSVISKDLLLAILRKEIDTSKDAYQWLEKHKNNTPADPAIR